MLLIPSSLLLSALLLLMLASSNRNKFTFGFVAVSPLPPAAAAVTAITAKSSSSSLWLSLPSSSSFSSSLVPMITKNVAIVGCGPSGCLLAHLLLEQNNNNNNNNKNTQLRVTVVESRSDPRELHADGQQRAYALGIGIRGRTAIRQSQNIGTTTTNSSSSEDETIAEDGLWQAVRNCGYESQRFQLHAGPFVIPLRQEETKPNDGSTTSSSRTTEPSLLVYQSKLCGSLIEELERRYSTTTTSNTNEHDKGGGDNLQLLFNTPIQKCDVETMTLIPDSRSNNTGGGGGGDDDLGPFDVIIGCDGVNSIVRQTIESVHRGFESVTTQLDGEFKVVQMENFVFPSNVDPTAVSLIIPKAGSCTAFIEPTGTNSCCILFATNTKNRTATDTAAAAATNPIMSETKNKTAIVEALENAFPQWGGKGNKNNENNIHDAIADQLLVRKAGSASSVVCNTYNYGGKLALVGDSAHATGGVSGQGVNSALMDAAVLAECIKQNPSSFEEALLSYSKQQVPEGRALYDLSFGPKPKKITTRIKYIYQTIRNTLFRGKILGIGQPPLQTRLTTDLVPFAKIRQEQDEFYETPFLTQQEFNILLDDLHKIGMETN